MKIIIKNLCSNKYKSDTIFKKLMEAAAYNLHPDTWLVRHYIYPEDRQELDYIYKN